MFIIVYNCSKTLRLIQSFPKISKNIQKYVCLQVWWRAKHCQAKASGLHVFLHVTTSTQVLLPKVGWISRAQDMQRWQFPSCFWALSHLENNQDMGGSYVYVDSYGVSPMVYSVYPMFRQTQSDHEEIHSEWRYDGYTYRHTFRHALHALQKSMKFVASLCLQTVSGQLWWITLFKFGCDIYIYICIYHYTFLDPFGSVSLDEN